MWFRVEKWRILRVLGRRGRDPGGRGTHSTGVESELSDVVGDSYRGTKVGQGEVRWRCDVGVSVTGVFRKPRLPRRVGRPSRGAREARRR